MARPSYDVEKLIENIKRRCAVPTSQITYTDQDFTDLADDELKDVVVPLLMSTREEYFVDHIDVTVTDTRIIEIPEEAIGDKLRSVCYVQQSSPLVLGNIPRIDLDVVAGVGFSNFDAMAGFYVEGNNLVLYPNTSVPVGTQIRIYFYKRALKLAAPAQYGQVVSIDPMALSVVLNFVPTEWATGTVLNSVSNLPGFKITNTEFTILSTSAPTIFVDSVDGIEVGDYIIEQGYTGVPQIPVEAMGYLAQITASKCLEGLGDSKGMENADAKADKMKASLLVMISNRVDGSGKKIVNPSGGFRAVGLLRRGWGSW